MTKRLSKSEETNEIVIELVLENEVSKKEVKEKCIEFQSKAITLACANPEVKYFMEQVSENKWQVLACK